MTSTLSLEVTEAMEVKWSLGLESNRLLSTRLLGLVEAKGGWAREDVKEFSQESAEDVWRLEMEDKLEEGTLEVTLMVVT